MEYIYYKHYIKPKNFLSPLCHIFNEGAHSFFILVSCYGSSSGTDISGRASFKGFNPEAHSRNSKTWIVESLELSLESKEY